MNLYDSIFVLAMSIALVAAFTRWYVAGRLLIIALFTIDLIASTLIQFNLIRIIFAIIIVASIAREMHAEHTTKKKISITLKTKMIGGIVIGSVGALTLFVLSYGWYLLVAGLIIVSHAAYQLRAKSPH